MIIYGALLIPVIAAIILYWKFSHKTVWWEFLIPFAASLIFCISAKAIIEYVQVQSKEYWGSFVKRIEYYEDWNEYIHRTCTRSCGKNCTETYDCSYVDYHPAYWQIVTTTDEVVEIDESEYDRLKQFFGGETFVELGRNYYTDDGDEYYCAWKGDSAKAIPVTTQHYYENRIKAADQSVFHFRQVDTADIRRFGLKDYPPITDYYKQDVLLGDDSPDAPAANKKLQYINGLLGHEKEVRLFVILFPNQPVDAGLYQESYWSGANMNEFVVAIGIDKNRNVTWCHPFSWTTNEELKAHVKMFVHGQSKLDLQALAGYLQTELEKGFVRRNFDEFSYLKVEPPTWAVLLTYFLTALVNFGLAVWIIGNEYEEYGDEDDNAIFGRFKDFIRKFRRGNK